MKSEVKNKKSEIKKLCDKINNELEKAPTYTTLSSLVEGLNANAMKQLILGIWDTANDYRKDDNYYRCFAQTIAAILMLSKQTTLKDIINELTETRINLLEELLEKRRKAIILYTFIKTRNHLIKQYNATGDEFNIYDINDKFNSICNAYVSDPKYNTPEHTWQDLDMLTTGPIFDISEHTFGRNGKFKKIFDNIDDIMERVNT